MISSLAHIKTIQAFFFFFKMSTQRKDEISVRKHSLCLHSQLGGPPQAAVPTASCTPGQVPWIPQTRPNFTWSSQSISHLQRLLRRGILKGVSFLGQHTQKTSSALQKQDPEESLSWCPSSSSALAQHHPRKTKKRVPTFGS